MNHSRPVLTLKRPQQATRKAVVLPKKRRETPPVRTVSDEDFLAALQVAAPGLWDPEAPKPLAIGIHKQLYPLAERLRMSRRSLRSFLARWTASMAYQRALQEPDASRYNLDGSSAGEVSAEHRELARRRVAPETAPH